MYFNTSETYCPYNLVENFQRPFRNPMKLAKTDCECVTDQMEEQTFQGKISDRLKF